MKTLKACGALLFISNAVAAFPNRIVLSLVVCSVDIFTDIYCLIFFIEILGNLAIKNRSII